MSPEIGTHIGRYEILSVIATGGMGKVFLARDPQLNRRVAIKVLKNAGDTEALVRFRQEALAVSSLNHPNILTIFEIGEDDGVRYMVSEYLEGETLRQKLAAGPIATDDAIEIAVQVGGALAAAHKANVVHRDIKPENLMISPDGHVKVLDFGLAKLVNSRGMFADDPEQPTVTLLQTQRGMIVGTIGYMSPEQLRGQSVDGQTDIWSLGIVFFEMVTGERPFAGSTVSDIIAAVLERPLVPMGRMRTDVPEGIDSAVAKALAKDRNDRYKTVGEFAAALKDARHNPAAGPVNTHLTEGSTRLENRREAAVVDTPELALRDTDGRRRSGSLGHFLLAAAIIAVVGGGLWFGTRWFRGSSPSAKQPTARQLSVKGNIVTAVISPNGQFVSYVQNAGGRPEISLRLPDESAGDGTKIVQLDRGSVSGISFTPDGKWLYYTVFNEAAVGTLYKVPITGGPPQPIAGNVDSAVTFSPDGESFAYFSRDTEQGVERLIVCRADGTEPRTVLEKHLPEFFTLTDRASGVAWAGDGTALISTAGGTASGQMSLIRIDLRSGSTVELPAKWPQISKVLSGGSGELFVTADSGGGLFNIFKISANGSNPRKLGDDLSDYKNISISSDDKSLITVKSQKVANFFTAASDLSGAVQFAQTSAGSFGGPNYLSNGKVIYVSPERGNRDIWQMNADGTGSEPLTFENGDDDHPSVSVEAGCVVYVSTREGLTHIWRMDLNGQHKTQLTDQGGESFPQISRDGKWVIYSSKFDGHFALWKVAADGGTPARVSDLEANWPAISPDGRSVACLARIAPVGAGSDQDKQVKLAVVSSDDGRILKLFDADKVQMSPEFPPVIRWSADGRSVTYVSTVNGISNIWQQPLQGGDPRRLSDFSTDRIFSFDWSGDGRQILYSRGTIRNDIVLFQNF